MKTNNTPKFTIVFTWITNIVDPSIILCEISVRFKEIFLQIIYITLHYKSPMFNRSVNKVDCGHILLPSTIYQYSYLYHNLQSKISVESNKVMKMMVALSLKMMNQC